MQILAKSFDESQKVKELHWCFIPNVCWDKSNHKTRENKNTNNKNFYCKNVNKIDNNHPIWWRSLMMVLLHLHGRSENSVNFQQKKRKVRKLLMEHLMLMYSYAVKLFLSPFVSDAHQNAFSDTMLECKPLSLTVSW